MGGAIGLYVVVVALLSLKARRHDTRTRFESVARLADGGTEVQLEPEFAGFRFQFLNSVNEEKSRVVGSLWVTFSEGSDESGGEVYRGNSLSISPVWMIPSRRRWLSAFPFASAWRSPGR